MPTLARINFFLNYVQDMQSNPPEKACNIQMHIAPHAREFAFVETDQMCEIMKATPRH